MVLLVIQPQTSLGWIPDDIYGKLRIETASRHSAYIFALVNTNEHDACSILQNYVHPWAIGAQDIWDRLPSLRGEFWANIIRSTPLGQMNIRIPLRFTILGDKLAEPNIKIYQQRAFSGLPEPSNVAGYGIKINPKDIISYFPHLKDNEDQDFFSIIDKDIIFLDNISFFSAKHKGDIPFRSAYNILNHSDTVYQINRINNSMNERPLNAQIGMPVQFSGALIMPWSSHEDGVFNTVCAERLIGIASIIYNNPGGIVHRLRISNNGYAQEVYSHDNWHKPYSDHSLFQQTTVNINENKLRKVLNLIFDSSKEKFNSAKEDYRILALETVSDSRRSGIPALQFVQIWMAIERLLPFQTETTLQLALSLSALYDATARLDAFEAIKKSYRLRSDIAHGYKYKRGQVIYTELNNIVVIFRDIFNLSIDFASSELLRAYMIGHILRAEPFSVCQRTD